jgi:hypothetical protein
LLVVFLKHGLWMMCHTCIGILLEAQIDLGDDYELCYAWLMHLFMVQVNYMLIGKFLQQYIS